MSIWVRSQSRETLVNINYFSMGAGNRVYGDINSNSDPNDCGFFLGEYASEEEAMAVLDEIQVYIKHLILSHGQYPVIYQMPEAKKFITACGGYLECCGILDGTKEGKCDHYAECKAAWDRGCR